MQVALLMLLALGAVGHVVLWVTLVNRFHGFGIHRLWVNALTLVCGVALVVIPLLSLAAVAPSLLGLDVLMPELFARFAWAYVAVCAAVSLLASAQRWHWRRHSERRGALLANHTTRVDLAAEATAPWTAPGIPSLMSRLPGNEVLTLVVQEKQLAIPRWTSEAGNVRIAHLSDLHMSGRITRAYFERVVEEVNRCRPHVIALTGDLVERQKCLEWVPATLGRLSAPGGVYFVLGNHDRHVGGARIVAALENVGLIHLGGVCRKVQIGEASIILAGNELPWFTPAADLGHCPPRAAHGLPLRIVLAHSPDRFGWAQANGVDLLLAGHVHGGQVCVPILGPIFAPSFHGVRYASGTFRSGDTILHVSRGTSSLTPLRWNCPPEIALLDLRPAGAA